MPLASAGSLIAAIYGPDGGSAGRYPDPRGRRHRADLTGASSDGGRLAGRARIERDFSPAAHLARLRELYAQAAAPTLVGAGR